MWCGSFLIMNTLDRVTQVLMERKRWRSSDWVIQFKFTEKRWQHRGTDGGGAMWFWTSCQAEMVVVVEGDNGGSDRLEGKGSSGADEKIYVSASCVATEGEHEDSYGR